MSSLVLNCRPVPHLVLNYRQECKPTSQLHAKVSNLVLRRMFRTWNSTIGQGAEPLSLLWAMALDLGEPILLNLAIYNGLQCWNSIPAMGHGAGPGFLLWPLCCIGPAMGCGAKYVLHLPPAIKSLTRMTSQMKALEIIATQPKHTQQRQSE